LSENTSPEQRHELELFLGNEWDERQIIFRSGTPIRNDHLLRVDYLKAAAIILPGFDFAPGGSDSADMRTIKTLMSITNHASERGVTLPYLVSEVYDARKVDIARAAYPGHLETVASDATISLLVAQNIRHPFLSYIYTELLSHFNGNDIRIKRLPEFANQTAESLTEVFPKAIVLGVLREKEGSLIPVLNPPSRYTLEETDHLVFIARNYEDTIPIPARKPKEFARGRLAPFSVIHENRQKLLILGWNDMIPALIQELDNYKNETFVLDIFSSLSGEERMHKLNRFALKPHKVKLKLLDGDYTVPSDLENIDVMGYDNIIMLGCDWLPSPEEADARTITGFLMLRSLLANKIDPPKVLLELLDPENHSLFTHSHEEVILSPLILSHILAHVALRPEMNLVFKELFSSGGAEIYMRPCRQYDLTPTESDFLEIQKHVSMKGEIAIGVKIHGKESLPDGGIELNPPRDKRWELTDQDEIIVLTTSA